MNFLHPEVLFLLILPLLLAVAAIVSARRKNNSWLALVSETHKTELLVRPAPWRRHFPTAFGLLALALVIIALARPYSGYTDRKDISMGRNIMLAIDVSRSMETRDVSPSRLEQARTAAYELMDALPDDNFGLIVFSGDAQLAVPLTHDHNALRESIEQINRSWASYGGTNLNNVLSCALDTFKQHSPDTTNALIILSDGEDTVGNSLSLVERARKEHLIVITVGIGTKTGDVIPDTHDRTGLYRDNNGQNVISKLNDESLIKLAKSTDGQYYAINSGNALASFVRSATSKLEAEEQSDQTTKIPNDQYTLFAIPALIFILLAIVIGTEWRSWKRKTALLLLFLLGAPLAKAENHTEQLLKALQNKQYEDVIRQLSDGPEEANPERQSRLQFAKGYAELKKNEPDLAKESFSKALLSNEPSIQAASLYNIGNINIEQQFQILRKLYTPAPGTSGQPSAPAQPDITQLKNIKQQLEQDTQSYKDALQIQPEFPACRNNLNKTETFIRKLDQEIKRLEEEKKKQEEQQNQQQQQNQQNQKKDDNKNDQNKQDQNSGDNNKNDQNKQNQKPGDNDKNDQNKQDQNSEDNNKNDQNKQDQNSEDNNKNDQNKQDQNSEDNNKNDQNKQDQNSGDNNKNDQSKQDQNPGDSNKNDQNKQDQNSGDNNKNDQSKQDQNPGDNDKNDRNKQDQNSGDNNKNDQNKQNRNAGEQGQPEPEQQQQPDKRPEQGDQQQIPPPEAELAPSKEAKEAGEKHRAAQILRMHTNEVKGAPYPTFKRPIAPPTKDY